MQNRHPIDCLADLRRQKAEIEEQIAAIRTLAIAGTIDLTGDEHTAELSERTYRSIPLETAKRVLSPEVFAMLVTETRQVLVRVTRKSCP